MEEIPDPRPRVVDGDGGPGVGGVRCTACAYPSVQPVPRCPVCGAAVTEATFAGTGEVFAATCLRVGVPGRKPPYAVAYVVLDDGPRILADTPGDTPLRPGERVAITGVSDRGDPVVAPVGGAR